MKKERKKVSGKTGKWEGNKKMEEDGEKKKKKKGQVNCTSDFNYFFYI